MSNETQEYKAFKETAAFKSWQATVAVRDLAIVACNAASVAMIESIEYKALVGDARKALEEEPTDTTAA
jgi:hypothetical protein